MELVDKLLTLEFICIDIDEVFKEIEKLTLAS